MKTSSGPRLGMTQTELVFTVGATLILAGILFPGLSSVREFGRRSSCQSNLKQIGLGFQQYVQDYNQKFPVLTGGKPPISTPTGGVWLLLKPYVKSEQLFQCPSEETPCKGANSNAYTDYQYNLVLGFEQNTGKRRGLPLSILTHPSVTVLANDSSTTYPDAYSAGCPGDTPAWICAPGKAMYNGQFAGSTERHMKTQNFLFTDGHVQAYEALTKTISASVWNYATPGKTSGGDPTYNVAP